MSAMRKLSDKELAVINRRRERKTNITLTLINKDTGEYMPTTMVTRDKLYAQRSPDEIKAAENWSKNVVKRVFGTGTYEPILAR